MKRNSLIFHNSFKDTWHCVLKNNHSRKIYIKINRSDEDLVNICDCFYVDRPWKTVPLKLQTKTCKAENLLRVFETELDKKFYGLEFVDGEEVLSTDEYINRYMEDKKKHKFLILVASGDVLKTRLKNRIHRVIYLEIRRNVSTAMISCCNYCDRRYKRDNALVSPAGLSTIYFEYSLDAMIKIVNDELNCDFTDVIITDDTFGFDETNLPICGSI